MDNRERAMAWLFVAGSMTSCGGASTVPPKVDAPRMVAHPTSAKDPVVAPVPLRRLTREEYNNTVHDLLGDATRPADAFPADEAAFGFESNNLAPVTSLHVERYMDAAEALAKGARKRVDTLAPCPAGTPHDACAHRFVDSFGRLAFRRPLDERERASFYSMFADKERRSDYAGGVELVVAAMLQSPQFLYRVEPTSEHASALRALTGYEVATRLSYFVWASTPDAALLDEAAAGKLDDAAGVERVARRMLADPRAVQGIRSFHKQWLGLRELDTESKDSAQFTPELRSAMVEETLRFSTKAVLSGGDALATLLTSPRTFVNAPLAKLYGLASPAGEDFVEVTLPADQRSGVLTQASVMTLLTSGDQPSPILRGKFVREKLLCQPIPPPPPNTMIALPKVDPTVTTKERFAQHRRDPTCAACHQLMDPIGFGFDHYDALGAFRAKDGAFPVDAVGELSMTDDADGPFDGAVELGKRLAKSEEARRCMATQWFRYALGRSERDEDKSSIDGAYRAFARAGFDVRELVVAVATSSAFRSARFEQGGAL